MTEGATTSSASKELGAKLEASLVRELRAGWRQVNDAYFGGRLTAPTLQLVPSRATLGRWIPATRTLEISRPLALEHPWGAVLEVLKHEMAHQFVHEVLGETSQSPHGRAFRDTCSRLGIDPAASGVPGALPQGDAEAKVIDRITRLLALADSPERHEAEAAMAAAQRLMLKHNLEVAPAQREYSFAQVGKATGRVGEHERLVAMILGKHFFVDAIWIPVYRPREGKRASILEICGTRANLAIAEYVHGFLHETAARLWRDHKRLRGIAADWERRAYLAGVMIGFADKLARLDTQSRREGLVWLADGDLTRYFRRRHPHVRNIRHAGQRRTDTWADGREAGRRIVLNKPVGAAATARGRLLPAKP